MSNTIDITIERISKSNYYKFDDMVYWRINGVERDIGQKSKAKILFFGKPSMNSITKVFMLIYFLDS